MDAEPALIEVHVRVLREGIDAFKRGAALRLGILAANDASAVAIGEAGAIPLLVELLRDGSADAKLTAAFALRHLAWIAANRILIADAGGITPLVALLRDGSTTDAKQHAAWALGWIAYNDDGSAVAIAEAIGLDALVELARHGRVSFKEGQLLSNATLPAKRKAALVVAALLGGCVPDSARRRVPVVLQAAIGSYL